MKTTPVSRITLIAAVTLATAGAQGEDRPPRDGHPPGPPEWAQHDANGDGSLSLEEFRTMPRVARLPEEQQARLFQRLDTNNDGKLDKAEVFRRRPGRDPQRPQENRRRIMELDADKSGGVSLEELRAGELFSKMPPERLQALFKRLDTDGDGEITPKDRPEFPPDGRRPGPPRGDRPDRPDRPDRGDLRPDRPAPPGWHRRIFAELDTDQSGTLSFEEFRKARPIAGLDEDAQEARFMRLDANGDKSLDPAEFSKMPAGPPPPGDGRRGPPSPAERGAPSGE